VQFTSARNVCQALLNGSPGRFFYPTSFVSLFFVGYNRVVVLFVDASAPQGGRKQALHRQRNCFTAEAAELPLSELGASVMGFVSYD
jgi:hypothetical protein